MARNPTVAYWWRGKPNFGDLLNVSLIKRLTGSAPFHVHDMPPSLRAPVYSVIGSVLHVAVDARTTVWGSGFISQDSRFQNAPARIAAIRGPRSRSLAIAQGVSCPDVFGDPALLYPLLYQAVVPVKYKLGLIPHLWDKRNPLVAQFRDDDVLIIDVAQKPDKVIQQIRSCEAVASSSLHGIILALAYRVRSIWVDFSDKVEGNGFKFLDFFDSIEAPVRSSVVIQQSTDWRRLYDDAIAYPIHLDLERLLSSCPFMRSQYE